MQLALGDLGVLLSPWLHALKPADTYGSPSLQYSLTSLASRKVCRRQETSNLLPSGLTLS